jgi:hypothetical protein
VTDPIFFSRAFAVAGRDIRGSLHQPAAHTVAMRSYALQYFRYAAAGTGSAQGGDMTTEQITAGFTVVLALATNLAISEASAEPNKEQYELQERCGKRAAEVFKSIYKGGGVTSTENGQDIMTYQNHYSAIFNKCFFLEIRTSVNYKTQDRGTSTMITLFDVNENKDYGTFFMRSVDGVPITCNVEQKICHSRSEWDELLRPYMEQ